MTDRVVTDTVYKLCAHRDGVIVLNCIIQFFISVSLWPEIMTSVKETDVMCVCVSATRQYLKCIESHVAVVCGPSVGLWQRSFTRRVLQVAAYNRKCLQVVS